MNVINSKRYKNNDENEPLISFNLVVKLDFWLFY